MSALAPFLHSTATRPRRLVARSMSSAVFSAAAGRNKDPILDVLRRFAPRERRPGLSHLFYLEVASGFGEHVGHFARNTTHGVPTLWQPSDRDSNCFPSVRAHATADVLDPVILDVLDDTWTTHPSADVYWKQSRPAVQTAFDLNRERRFDMVLNINMVHISPAACTDGLFRGASSVLCPTGRLILYGPFKIGGQHTAASNARFDATLKGMNPDYGVRDFEALVEAGRRHGLVFLERIPMPANNFVLVFEKSAPR